MPWWLLILFIVGSFSGGYALRAAMVPKIEEPESDCEHIWRNMQIHTETWPKTTIIMIQQCKKCGINQAQKLL